MLRIYVTQYTHIVSRIAYTAENHIRGRGELIQTTEQKLNPCLMFPWSSRVGNLAKSSLPTKSKKQLPGPTYLIYHYDSKSTEITS